MFGKDNVVDAVICHERFDLASAAASPATRARCGACFLPSTAFKKKRPCRWTAWPWSFRDRRPHRSPHSLKALATGNPPSRQAILTTEDTEECLSQLIVSVFSVRSVVNPTRRTVGTRSRRRSLRQHGYRPRRTSSCRHSPRSTLPSRLPWRTARRLRGSSQTLRCLPTSACVPAS